MHGPTYIRHNLCQPFDDIRGKSRKSSETLAVCVIGVTILTSHVGPSERCFSVQIDDDASIDDGAVGLLGMVLA